MQDLFLLADELQSFCQARGWRFCFIGGIALQRWGEPRLTGDVDLTILTGFGGEAGYIEDLCGAFARAIGRVAAGGRPPAAPSYGRNAHCCAPPAQIRTWSLNHPAPTSGA